MTEIVAREESKFRAGHITVNLFDQDNHVLLSVEQGGMHLNLHLTFGEAHELCANLETVLAEVCS